MDEPINKPPNHEDIPEKTITIQVFDNGRRINVFTEENGPSEHFFTKDHYPPDTPLNDRIMVALAIDLDYEPIDLLNIDWDAIGAWEYYEAIGEDNELLGEDIAELHARSSLSLDRDILKNFKEE